MKLTCPKCLQKIVIEDPFLSLGKRLQCSHCNYLSDLYYEDTEDGGEFWLQTPED